MSRCLTRTLLLTLFSFSAGCLARSIGIQELKEPGSLQVSLDANQRAFEPSRRIKFFVEILNQTSDRLDLKNLKVELLVSPEEAPEKVSLRNPWSYRWGQEMLLEPGKKLTLPIVPEKGVELPLEHLPPGNYSIIAVLNGRYTSKAYSLRIVRPDLEGPIRRS